MIAVRVVALSTRGVSAPRADGGQETVCFRLRGAVARRREPSFAWRGHSHLGMGRPTVLFPKSKARFKLAEWDTVIPALRQEGLKFEDSLGSIVSSRPACYRASPCLKKQSRAKLQAMPPAAGRCAESRRPAVSSALSQSICISLQLVYSEMGF